MTNPFTKFFYFLAITGLVLVNFIAQPVFAVAPEDLSVLISDSRPSTVTNVTITYDQSASGDFSAGDTLVITFPTAMDTSGFASTDALDYDIEVAGTPETVVDSTDACSTDVIEITSVAADVFTFTACSGYVGEAADTIIEIQIGTHATTGGTGNTQAITSTAGTYTFTADATDEDAKDALVAVVAGVDISATVDESLSVTVTGITAVSTNCVDLGGAPTDVDTTATAVTYGTVSTEAFYTGCQKIAVDTNAAGGYTATVAQTQLLTSGGNTIAEGTCDGTCNDTTLGGWETATNNGFAYCADDITGNAGADAGIAAGSQCDDATPEYYTFFTDPTEPTVDFMFSAGPISDETNISYHLSVPGSTPAGTFSNTTYYVVTATF
ncbi:MAG: hypothetical protein WEC83_00185 [Patescibacteria group bacterium]